MKAAFDTLFGQTLASIEGASKDSEQITIKTTDGTTYTMYHDQDCCEHVYVEDVVGDPKDLIGSPILQAEESTSRDEKPKNEWDSYTWTFYRLATIKGSVVIRWCGESNGYYSESVDFVQGNPDDEHMQ